MASSFSVATAWPAPSRSIGMTSGSIASTRRRCGRFLSSRQILHSSYPQTSTSSASVDPSRLANLGTSFSTPSRPTAGSNCLQCWFNEWTRAAVFSAHTSTALVVFATRSVSLTSSASRSSGATMKSLLTASGSQCSSRASNKVPTPAELLCFPQSTPHTCWYWMEQPSSNTAEVKSGNWRSLLSAGAGSTLGLAITVEMAKWSANSRPGSRVSWPKPTESLATPWQAASVAGSASGRRTKDSPVRTCIYARYSD